jgi:catechol 2,3-dioxygenase-like lactoylglutathione lyase family enzyme
VRPRHLLTSKKGVDMIDVKRLGHVTYATPDLKRQVEYYVEVVGLAVTGEESGKVVLSTRLGEEAVVFEQGPAAACVRLSFQVGDDVDLAELSRQVDGFGGKAERRSDVTPGIAGSVVFNDPYGTAIELFKAPRTFGMRDVAGVGPLKIGHVAFVVPDAKHLTDYYVGNLGFRVSDWMADFFAFLRCSPDHHTVNFISEAGSPRIHHCAYEAKDWAHIQAACDLLGQRKRPIIWGPGRHGIGHNIFIYHRDPDDHIVEFYAELDQMKDESLGYFDPRPWHDSYPQRPHTWDVESASLVWGTPPTPDFLRGGTRENAPV